MNPQLLTRKYLVSMVAEHWKGQYKDQYGKWKDVFGDKSSKDIYNKLFELGLNPDIEEVNRIIGNTSWTDKILCDQCGGKYEEVVIVGERQNWESSTARLCKQCVVNALSLFER